MTAFDPATVSVDSVQLELVLAPLVHPVYELTMSNAEKFAAFHAANPHVADALEALAAQKLAVRQKVGIASLYERLRWEADIQTIGDSYRLNNNHRAYYTRLLEERHPEWVGRIPKREQRDEAA